MFWSTGEIHVCSCCKLKITICNCIMAMFSSKQPYFPSIGDGAQFSRVKTLKDSGIEGFGQDCSSSGWFSFLTRLEMHVIDRLFSQR